MEYKLLKSINKEKGRKWSGRLDLNQIDLVENSYCLPLPNRQSTCVHQREGYLSTFWRNLEKHPRAQHKNTKTQFGLCNSCVIRAKKWSAILQPPKFEIGLIEQSKTFFRDYFAGGPFLILRPLFSKTYPQNSFLNLVCIWCVVKNLLIYRCSPVFLINKSKTKKPETNQSVRLGNL